MIENEIYSVCLPCNFSQNNESLNCTCSLTISKNFVGISLVNIEDYADIACFELNQFDELLTIGISCTFFSVTRSQISICFTNENNFLRFIFSLSESCCIVPNIHKNSNYYIILKNNLCIPKGNYSFISNRHEDYFYYLIKQSFIDKVDKLSRNQNEIDFCDLIIHFYHKQYLRWLDSYLDRNPQNNFSKIPINLHNILNWCRSNLKINDCKYTKLLHHYSKIKIPKEVQREFSKYLKNSKHSPKIAEHSVHLCQSYFVERNTFRHSYLQIANKVALLINGRSDIHNDMSKIPKWLQSFDEKARNEMSYSIFTKIVSTFKKFDLMKNPIQSIEKLIFRIFQVILPEFSAYFKLHNITELLSPDTDYSFLFSDSFDEIWRIWFWIISRQSSENSIIALYASQIFFSFPKILKVCANNELVNIRDDFPKLCQIDSIKIDDFLNFADYLYTKYDSKTDVPKSINS